MTEDEMVGWHHRLHRHEFEQASGVGDSCIKKKSSSHLNRISDGGAWWAAVYGVTQSRTGLK